MLALDFHPGPAKLRQFGFVGCGISAILGFLRLYRSGAMDAISLSWFALAMVLLMLAVIRPAWLRYPFVGLSVVTFPVGYALSFLFAAIIFFGAITPVALFFRLCKRDRLKLRNQPRDSYWEERPAAPAVEQYFRQF